MSDSLLVPTPIITVKEARKLLGKNGECLSDEEVAELINDLAAIAKPYIQEQPNY